MGLFKKIIKKYFVRNVISSINTPVLEGKLLKDKVALIVGGAGGIGFAIAKAFFDNGCKVIITGRDEDKLINLCETIKSSDFCYFCMGLDDINKFDAEINNIVSIYGKIDILVYGAGVHGNDMFGSIRESTWDNVMNINLKAMYFICQSVSNYMIRNAVKGHILTVSSASCNKPGWTPYEISKNAVRALTLGMADKLISHGIVVNSIAPGPVATKMLQRNNENLSWEGNPTGRMCTPEEIANIAVIMVSDVGNMIVGDTYFVSGGSGTICLDK